MKLSCFSEGATDIGSGSSRSTKGSSAIVGNTSMPKRDEAKSKYSKWVRLFFIPRLGLGCFRAPIVGKISRMSSWWWSERTSAPAPSPRSCIGRPVWELSSFGEESLLFVFVMNKRSPGQAFAFSIARISWPELVFRCPQRVAWKATHKRYAQAHHVLLLT